MPVVVSDSSTLIHLAAIGRLTLLKEFFGVVTIPMAVWREVVVQGHDRSGAIEIKQAYQEGWIEIETPKDPVLLQLLRRDLDDGESEVIALAVERGAALVLIDESEARKIAEMYGLMKTGVIGILIRARRAGRVESLRIELDNLLTQGGFWIEDKLYKDALRAVGELD